MAIISDRVKEQLLARFESSLEATVQLRVYTRPGSSRLILPSGVGCATCGEAREIAEALHNAAPEKISVEVIDITQSGDHASDVADVPTIVVSSAVSAGRIRFQGLPAGTEFPALVDAIERVSRSEHGLSEDSLAHLAKLTETTEVMVFATPT